MSFATDLYHDIMGMDYRIRAGVFACKGTQRSLCCCVPLMNLLLLDHKSFDRVAAQRKRKSGRAIIASD